MPTIPVTNRQPLAQTATPSIQAPLGAFNTAPPPVDFSAVQKQALEMQDHADQMAVDAAELAHSQLQTDVMTQATKAQGINALEAAKSAQDTYQQQSAKIIEGLPNDRVKQLVAHRAQGYFAHLYEATESHAAAETKKADAQNITALLNNDLETASALPSMAPGLADTARARTIDYGKRNGWTDAQIEDQAAQRVSAVHSAAIGKLLQDADPRDVSMAASYLENYKSALVGKQRADAEQLVDAAQAQSVGFNESDRILGLNQPANGVVDETQAEVQQGVTPQNTAPLTMTQALALAEQIPDARARKAATQEIVSHFSHLETAQRYDREAARARMIQKVEQAGGKLNRADPDWLTISGFQEGEHVEHRSDQLLKPAKDPGDADAFLSHLNTASISPASRAEFLRMDFTGKDGEGLNTSQKTHLINLQRQYRGQDVRTDDTEIRRADAEDHRLMTADLKRLDTIADADERRTEEQRINRFYQSRKMQRHGTAPGNAPSAPTTGSGDVSFAGTPKLGGAVDPSNPYNLAHVSPVAPMQATPQQLEGAARNPAYAEYLRNMGVALPKKLPLPVEAPKK